MFFIRLFDRSVQQVREYKITICSARENDVALETIYYYQVIFVCVAAIDSTLV